MPFEVSCLEAKPRKLGAFNNILLSTSFTATLNSCPLFTILPLHLYFDLIPGEKIQYNILNEEEIYNQIMTDKPSLNLN
jgi:hypothetical protein